MDHASSGDMPSLTDTKHWLALGAAGDLPRLFRPWELVRLVHDRPAGVDDRVVICLADQVIRQAKNVLFNYFRKGLLRTHDDVEADWEEAVGNALIRLSRALSRRDTKDAEGLREDFFNRLLLMGRGGVRKHDRKMHRTKTIKTEETLSDGQVIKGRRREAPAFVPLPEEAGVMRGSGHRGRAADRHELISLAQVRLEKTIDADARRWAVAVSRAGGIKPVAENEGVSKERIKRALGDMRLDASGDVRAAQGGRGSKAGLEIDGGVRKPQGRRRDDEEA